VCVRSGYCERERESEWVGESEWVSQREWVGAPEEKWLGRGTGRGGEGGRDGEVKQCDYQTCKHTASHNIIPNP
jgi:hypothetical protein